MIPFLANQFAIGADPASHPQGGRPIRLETITVTLFAGAKSNLLRAPDGTIVGLLIGTPIDREVGVVGEDLVVQDTKAEAVAESLYARLAGSWLCVLEIGGEKRVYLDANGTKSLVFNPDAKLAGSTAQILFPAQDEYDRNLDRALFVQLGVGGDGWFPAGLTAHRGVERLLANHYLDLQTFEAVRHWPNAPVMQCNDVDGVLRDLCARIAHSIGSLAADKPTHVALTAGNETRLLLACCRTLLDCVDFFTSAAPGTALDVLRAKELAARFGLRHHVLPYAKASEEEADAWLRRVGHSLTGSNLYAHPTVWPLSGYMVGGSSGEVARGFLWLNADAGAKLTAEGIVDRLKLPRVPQLVERVERWLSGLAFDDALFILDVAYIELRMSGWGYAQAYANPTLEAQHVLVSRPNFEAMLSLPADLRRGDAAIVRAIQLVWPELLTLPINRYGDWRDKVARFERVLRHPGKLLSKLRQLRARAA